MKTLKIAADLSLPLDVVTQTLLVVGKRGSGKSNTAARLVEQFHRAGLPFVVLDPTDTWWGLKASADGAGPGLANVYVFGGRKQDLPLEAHGGALLAEVLCEHRMSMVLSVKHLSGGERSRFMVAFAQTLFQKWGGGPLHVVLEEAHELAPQMAARGGSEGEAAMLGAFKRLWKLGRASGIGGTAVTQRPASLSKDITTQSEILVAHRTIGPQDVKAVGEWIKYHGEQLEVLADLPSLPTGQAIVWAPEFPEGKPLGLVRATVLRRDTYDSASTPKVGEQRVEPKELAAVDLERLRTKMAATIEKAKADDPKELRKQLAAVSAELARAQQVTSSSKQASGPVQSAKTVEVLTDADRELLTAVAARLGALPTELQGHLADFVKAAAELLAGALGKVMDGTIAKHEAAVARSRAEFVGMLEKRGLARILEKLARVAVAPRHDQPTTRAHALARPSTSIRLTTERQATSTSLTEAARRGRVPLSATVVREVDGVSRPQQAILNALAWGESMRLPTQRREKVAFLADASPKSSAFMNNLGALRSAGYIDYPQQGYVALTESGRALAQVDAHAPQTSAELQQAICAKLPGPQARIIAAAVRAYPDALEREALADQAGASATSSAYMNNLGALRSLGLLDYPRQGLVQAAPVLFLEA